MKNTLFTALIALPLAVAAEPSDYFGNCMSAVLAEKPGQVMKVEFKLEDEQEVYEFNIRGLDGHDWDLECQKASAEIVEIEREVSNPNHPLFKTNVKYNEQEARDIALALHPGKIVEVEYEIEANGNSSYEFDIETSQGFEMKIEIDAATGEVIETNKELWQVGLE
ncbi:PepSY domain-containing protein [uncultured Methylophaga sp.]|uniref:PepSY domain-containing protein n=1 Tax=uncultured Methylophaga sp. TaxID=285271 RepID=UPI00261777C4|nr:PepSY domain-containing protein [uncultured Methylophaga sp.]